MSQQQQSLNHSALANLTDDVSTMINPPNDVKRKLCSSCKNYKPVNEFYKRSVEADGYGYRCKLCIKTYTQQRRDKLKREQKIVKKTDKSDAWKRYKQICEQNEIMPSLKYISTKTEQIKAEIEAIEDNLKKKS